MSARVQLPRKPVDPIRTLGRRFALAVGLILYVALVSYIWRDGYADNAGGGLSALDALYYSTVSITTTGYGDISPQSDSARLTTTFLVTPARILFLIVLVGTTLEILAERGRESYELSRWRKRLKDHVIVCGFGSKGKRAMRTLIEQGVEPAQFVVIDRDPEARAAASAQGAAAVIGNAASMDVLREAGVETARAVVVAVDRDDTAVLVTLSAREVNSQATIVSAAREEENVHLLHQSGATSVITSSSATGRLLGLATVQPKVVEVLEDLMSVGGGLDLAERPVQSDEMGPISNLRVGDPIVAVVRGDEVLRFDDPRAQKLEAGDKLVYLHAHG